MLHLALFGTLRLALDRTPIELTTPPKTLHLLAYLLLHRHEALTRDQLAFTFWPDRSEAEARGQLRRYLYRLRQLLPPGDWLITRGESVQWNLAADYVLDVQEFESAAGSPPDELAAAQQLYVDDLLPDLYDDWLMLDRERLRELYLANWQTLLAVYRDRREYARAIDCAQQILKREPLRETIVRELMRLRAASGERARALADYRQFQARVQEELGVPPLPETIALYDELRQTSPLVLPPAHSRLIKVPAPLTRLLGREVELAAVSALLTVQDLRLVTLTGPGGTGKTRLAQAVAQHLAQHTRCFAHGLIYVSLSSLSAPEFVLPAIATALDVLDNRPQAIGDAVSEALRDKDLLLILDNFEHVLDAAPIVTELLSASAHLRVLVTSREVLHLYGEYEYEVPPLLNDAAVTLFVERARAVRRDLALTPDNAATIAEICARLDGLPLAIELAAARSKLFNPTQMLQRLTDRLGFLVSTTRDRPDRQQTLRNVIDWSYNLLADHEKHLFSRLSVFAGSFTVEAVEALGLATTDRVGVAPTNALDQLAALVDKNMLRAVKPDRPDDEPRFRWLLTLRDYAEQRLRASGEWAALHDRHAQYCLSVAEQSARAIGGPQQADWLRRLAADRDNFRAALSWLLDQAAQTPTGLQLAVALGQFWLAHGDWAEGEQWLKRALALNPAGSVWRARALNLASEFIDKLGDSAHAETLAAESLTLFQALGDARGQADALCNLASARLTQNDYAEAEPWVRQALALYRQEGALVGEAEVLSTLGLMAKEQGDFAQAAQYFEASLRLCEQLGNALGASRMWVQISYNAYWQGDYERAAEYAQQAVTVALLAGSRRAMAVALDSVGCALARLGRSAEAQAALTESLALQRELGNKGGQAMVLADLASAALDAHAEAQAAGLYREALALAWQIGDRRRAAFCLEGLGQITADDDAGQAAVYLSAAQAVRQTLSAPLPPSEQRPFDRTVAALQAALGPAAFATAWQRGADTPLDQVVARALGGGNQG